MGSKVLPVVEVSRRLLQSPNKRRRRQRVREDYGVQSSVPTPRTESQPPPSRNQRLSRFPANLVGSSLMHVTLPPCQLAPHRVPESMLDLDA